MTYAMVCFLGLDDRLASKGEKSQQGGEYLTEQRAINQTTWAEWNLLCYDMWHSNNILWYVMLRCVVACCCYVEDSIMSWCVTCDMLCWWYVMLCYVMLPCYGMSWYVMLYMLCWYNLWCDMLCLYMLCHMLYNDICYVMTCNIVAETLYDDAHLRRTENTIQNVTVFYRHLAPWFGILQSTKQMSIFYFCDSSVYIALGGLDDIFVLTIFFVCWQSCINC